MGCTIVVPTVIIGVFHGMSDIGMAAHILQVIIPLRHVQQILIAWVHLVNVILAI